MMRVAIFGAMGKMGQAVAIELLNEADAEVVAAIAAPGSADVGKRFPPLPTLAVTDVLEPGVADVLIDFSTPAGFMHAAKYAEKNRVAFVSGTTGLAQAHFDLLNEVANFSATVWAANFSRGIAVLRHLAVEAANALDDFDIEILEMHHRYKKDSPSGTAKQIAEDLRDAKGWPEWAIATNPDARGERKEESIGVMALRGGSVVGEHDVIFAGAGERVILQHIADERAIFARGAITAARFAISAKPGRYRMQDVLGLTH